MSARALLAGFLLGFAALATVVPSTLAQRAGPAEVTWVAVEQLPPEARHTLALIRKGGPYPYARDGVTFTNREGRLPRQKRGYYREFTVPTPGERTRGARRIVAGADGDAWYTEDHYNSFRRIREKETR